MTGRLSNLDKRGVPFCIEFFMQNKRGCLAKNGKWWLRGGANYYAHYIKYYYSIIGPSFQDCPPQHCVSSVSGTAAPGEPPSCFSEALIRVHLANNPVAMPSISRSSILDPTTFLYIIQHGHNCVYTVDRAHLKDFHSANITLTSQRM